MMLREELRRRLLEDRGTGANPLAFDEIKKLSKRPWGGPLRSNRCFCCGSGMDLANHHITSRAEGGSDSHRNKVTLCSTCHDAVEGMEWPAILARRKAMQIGRSDDPAIPEAKDRAPCYADPSKFLFWTKTEEAAFAEIQAVSRLTRIQAIHLWKRCRKNTKRAVKMAKEQYAPLSQAVLDKLASMRAIKRAIAKTERPRVATNGFGKGLGGQPPVFGARAEGAQP